MEGMTGMEIAGMEGRLKPPKLNALAAAITVRRAAVRISTYYLYLLLILKLK